MSRPSTKYHILILVIISLLLIITSISLFWLSESFEKDTIRYTLITSLALSLGPLSIMLILDRYLFTKSSEKIIASSFKEEFHEHTKILSYGVHKVHPDLQFQDIFKDTRKGDVVDILDTYIPDLGESFLCSLEKALCRGVEVRLLLSKPESIFSKQRAKELGSKYTNNFTPQIAECVDSFIKVADNVKTKGLQPALGVRLYDSYASIPMYLVHQSGGSIRRIYFSFFLCDASRYAIHIELRNDTFTNSKEELLKSFKKYFESKWQESEQDTLMSRNDLKQYVNTT